MVSETVTGLPIKFRPEPEPLDERDPVAEATDYVNNKWFVQLVAVRTECFLCHKPSPVIQLPSDNCSLAFGNPRMLWKRGSDGRRIKMRDVTAEAVRAFGAHGWKFQLKRSYCPTCKGLGSV